MKKLTNSLVQLIVSSLNDREDAYFLLLATRVNNDLIMEVRSDYPELLALLELPVTLWSNNLIQAYENGVIGDRDVIIVVRKTSTGIFTSVSLEEIVQPRVNDKGLLLITMN